MQKDFANYNKIMKRKQWILHTAVSLAKHEHFEKQSCYR